MPTQHRDGYRFTLGRTKADILVNEGAEKCIKGNHEEGLASFDKALCLDPENQAANFNKGITLISLGHQQILAGQQKVQSGLSSLAKVPRDFTDFATELLSDLD